MDNYAVDPVASRPCGEGLSRGAQQRRNKRKFALEGCLDQQQQQSDSFKGQGKGVSTGKSQKGKGKGGPKFSKHIEATSGDVATVVSEGGRVITFDLTAARVVQVAEERSQASQHTTGASVATSSAVMEGPRRSSNSGTRTPFRPSHRGTTTQSYVLHSPWSSSPQSSTRVIFITQGIAARSIQPSELKE